MFLENPLMGEIKSESHDSRRNAAERKKSNLAFAFFCMDRDRARDMEIFYAFCRLMDDIADDASEPPEVRREKLRAWKDEISRAYAGGENLSPLGLEMMSLVGRRNIPQKYVQDIIDGVTRDTFDRDFESFEDLRGYCYGVASAVGLASIHIFGFKNPRTIEFAETLGYALQFTNILRDVRDDALRLGRVYIPVSEMRHFGVSKEDLKDPSRNPACKKLFKLMHFRAKHFFNKARRLVAPEDRRALAPAFIMWGIYERILDLIAARDFDIPAKPLKISKLEKILLALSAIRRSKIRQPELKSGKAVVVGGGVAGACAALRAAREGFDVELVEARGGFGGRAASIEWLGARLDNGTHALMGCYENLFEYLELLGSDGADFFKPVKGMNFFFPGGKNLAVKFPGKRDGILKKLFSILRFRKLEGFFSFANLSVLFGLKTGIGLPHDNETALEFLMRKDVPRAAIDNFWEPFCVSALNTPLDAASGQLMANTARKSLLAGGDAALLYLPVQPLADAFGNLPIFIEGVGSRVRFGEKIEKFGFEKCRISAAVTSKGERIEGDFFVSALPPKAMSALLGDSPLHEVLDSLRQNAILNVYFTSQNKLFDCDYACLIGSPLHWIFDHSEKLPQSLRNGGLSLYGITVSACKLDSDKNSIRKLISSELEKFFGNFEIGEILPMRFADATLACSLSVCASRPNSRDGESVASNFLLCGDWIQTDLPSTLEGAALSANEIAL